MSIISSLYAVIKSLNEREGEDISGFIYKVITKNSTKYIRTILAEQPLYGDNEEKSYYTAILLIELGENEKEADVKLDISDEAGLREKFMDLLSELRHSIVAYVEKYENRVAKIEFVKKIKYNLYAYIGIEEDVGFVLRRLILQNTQVVIEGESKDISMRYKAREGFEKPLMVIYDVDEETYIWGEFIGEGEDGIAIEYIGSDKSLMPLRQGDVLVLHNTKNVEENVMNIPNLRRVDVAHKDIEPIMI